MMTAMKSSPQTLYEQAFRSSLAALHEEQRPAWLEQLKVNAFQRFEALGLPTRHQDAWRFIDLGPIVDQQFQPVDREQQPQVSPETLQDWIVAEAQENCLVFINGVYAPSLSKVSALPSGVIVSDLNAALSTHEALLQNALAQDISEESDAFTILNTTLFQDGAVISIPDNVELNTPIQLLFLTKPQSKDVPQAAYPRVLVVAGRHAKASVIVSFVGETHQPVATLNNTVIELSLAEGAQVKYSFTQAEASNAFLMANSRALLQRNSQLFMTSTTLGGELSRNHVHVKLLGEGAQCEIKGLSVLTDDAEAHDYTVIEHVVPHCTSRQLYKSILDRKAISGFDGTIVIHKDAQQSDASQLNCNLLLSDDANVFTRPQLKIDADDVKCSHGATVGQLDEDQLFYLASRGLSTQVARNVLTYGFAEEIVEKITIPGLRKQLTKRFLQNLEAGLKDENVIGTLGKW